MKKNKSMRIAAALLVLTLLSTCAISGTFAKYVTSDSSADTARVAKWGVVLTAANDSNFETSYATHDEAYSGALSVESSDTDSVVAPGTSGTAITFAITGTPEVATKVDIEMNVTSDIVVPAGEYLDWTTSGDDADTFEVADDYYPVVFTLTQGETVLATGNLADIKDFLENTYAATAYYAPNTTLDATFTLNWAWAFENEGMDAADTLLGNNIAGIASDADVSTLIEYDITFTVTQVD